MALLHHILFRRFCYSLNAQTQLPRQWCREENKEMCRYLDLLVLGKGSYSSTYVNTAMPNPPLSLPHSYKIKTRITIFVTPSSQC